jgi:hypothetical protein
MKVMISGLLWLFIVVKVALFVNYEGHDKWVFYGCLLLLKWHYLSMRGCMALQSDHNSSITF